MSEQTNQNQRQSTNATTAATAATASTSSSNKATSKSRRPTSTGATVAVTHRAIDSTKSSSQQSQHVTASQVSITTDGGEWQIARRRPGRRGRIFARVKYVQSHRARQVPTDEIGNPPGRVVGG